MTTNLLDFLEQSLEKVDISQLVSRSSVKLGAEPLNEEFESASMSMLANGSSVANFPVDIIVYCLVQPSTIRFRSVTPPLTSSLSLAVSLSFSLPISLSLCPSLCLSVLLSVCLSICLSTRLSARLSILLSVCLSVSLSLYPSVCLSVLYLLAIE